MLNQTTEQNQNYELIPFENGAGKTVKLSFFENDIWATQQQMAELFDTTVQNISMHLKNIFAEGELDENLVVKKNLKNDNHAGFRPLKESLVPNKYKLDAMISVGFRVSSKKGTNFRIRANQIIRERMQQEFERRYGNYQPIQPATSYTEFEIFNFFSNLIYLPIKTISQITKISVWAFQRQCKAGKLEARKICIKGESNHPHYEIAVSSLDLDSKKKIFEHLKTQNQLSLLIDKAKNIQQMLLTGNSEAINSAKMLLSNDLILTNGKGWSYAK